MKEYIVQAIVQETIDSFDAHNKMSSALTPTWKGKQIMLKAQAVKLSDSEDTCDPVNSPSHYIGKIECIDYLRDKLTQEEFTGFCMGNVLKYSSRWRKKDGLQDLKKAKVYLDWAIENEEKGS